MADWIGVIGVVLGTILGAGIQEFRFWMGRKQRYRIMTFDKRLEAHQMAFNWCQQLNRILNIGDGSEIHRIATEARQWWDGNCLLLDKISRKKMVGVFNLAHAYANDKQVPVGQEVRLGNAVWNHLDESLKAILEGIGAEYLPEMKREDKNGKD